MRRMQWLLGITFGTAVVIVACGGSSSDNNNGTPDSGAPDTSTDTKPPTTDASDASVADTNPPVCTTDADLNTLTPADAALGDAGGSVGKCLACSKAKCTAQVTDCNGDCDCLDSTVCVYDCLSHPGSSILACGQQCLAGGGLGGGGPTQSLLLCVAGACVDECAVPSFGQTDSGPKDTGAKDGTADSSSDAAPE